MEGWIVKSLSGYYYVSPDLTLAETTQCRARGVFRKKGLVPLTGDRVHFEKSDNGEGTVTEILPRSTELVRPPVANAEVAVLVFSVDEPALNLQLLDKFIVHTEQAGLETVICLTKSDLIDTDDPRSQMADIIQLYEQIGYEVFITSVKEMLGFKPIVDRLSGKISVVAGQSGVGKSTMLNAMIPGLELGTGEISHKLGRGRHTTRHVELIPLPGGGLVADTPGFSQLDFHGLEAEQLGECFAEFRSLAGRCKFRGCLHRSEPGCQVTNAVDQGRIPKSRYEHYVQFVEEILDRKKRY
jgi:ribosome biogenesis GTPase